MYHNFIVLSIYTAIMSGNLKRKRCAYDTNFKLKVIQYLEKCKTVWDSIGPVIIVRAFKKCSFTRAGTEGDILWQDDRDAPCADSDIEGEEMYDDMLTTDQMMQMLEEDDSD